MVTDVHESGVPGELPRGAERLAVAALALAAFALNLNVNVMGALLPFLRGLGFVSGDGVLWLVIASALGTAVGSLAVDAVARRSSRRAALLGGLSLFVVASALHLLASSVVLLVVLRAVAGIAAGLSYAAASALAAEVSPYARRGAAMSWFSAGMFLAIPVGMPLAASLAAAGYWPAIFGVQAAFGLVAAAVALRVVPDLRVAPASARWRDVLGNGEVRAGLGATMLHVGSFFTVVQLATSWLDDTGRVAKESQLWLWVTLGLLSVVGSASLGRLSDRVGKRRFVLGCSVVLVLCFGVLAGEPGLHVMLVTATALALAAAARTGPLQALVSGVVPRPQLPALMGLRSAAMQLGIGAFALGALPIVRGLGFMGVLWFAAGCQALSYLAVRLGVRERDGNQPDRAT